MTGVQTCALPISSVPFFATHHVLESQSDAAAEAIRQADIMMEWVKVVHESSQAAYDASAALRANVQKSCTLISKFAEFEEKQRQLNVDLELAQQNLKKAQDEVVGAEEKMRLALEKKDLDLATA